MPRKARIPPVLPWAQLALKTGEMLWASSQVIPIRLGRMAAAGHSPGTRDRREFARMGPEKWQAGMASMFAVGLALQQMQWRWLAQAWQPWLGLTRGAGSAGSQLARLSSAALAPIHRTATANARRLTRVKSSSGAAKR